MPEVELSPTTQSIRFNGTTPFGRLIFERKTPHNHVVTSQICG